MANLDGVMQLLNKEQSRLTKELQGISAALAAFGKTHGKQTGNRGRLSGAARARIAAAQRARWARVKASKSQNPNASAAPKRYPQQPARGWQLRNMSVDVPVVSQIVSASEVEPFLALRLALDMSVVREILSQQELPEPVVSSQTHGIAIGKTTEELLSACTRLTDLLNNPENIPFLGNTLQRDRMLMDGLDAATAAFEVGYESASQFSREYSRFFGQPPNTGVRHQNLPRTGKCSNGPQCAIATPEVA